MRRQTRVQGKGPAGVRERVERVREGPSVGDLGKTYASFMDGWSSFYQDMGSRLTTNLSKQQRAYEELLGRWNNLAGSAWKIVEGLAANESQRELSDVWRNYVNKIGTRMTRATTEGLRGYGEAAASLDRYANKIADVTRQVAAGKLETPRAEEIYETWLEVAGKLRQQMDRAADLTREEMEDLSKTWLEFSGRMESLLSGQLGEGGPYVELIDLWAKESKALAGALAGFILGHDHDNEETRKAWADHFLRMQGNMAELARAIGASYEEMYRRLLEGGATALSDLPLFPRLWSPEEQGTVRDLRRRIEELEREKAEAPPETEEPAEPEEKAS